jgi:putative oxidoreductase
MENMYKKFPWMNTDTGLLVLRLGLALVFISAGWAKFSDMPGTIGFFASMGFSAFWAYVVTWVELLGGVAVLFGFGTRLAAGLLAIVMIMASYKTKANPQMMMLPTFLLFTCVSLKLSGAGKYSFDLMKMKS